MVDKKTWKKIDEIFGIEAQSEVIKLISSLESKIADLIKSRDNWREKYTDLKNEIR